MSEHHGGAAAELGSSKGVVAGILAILVLYGVAAAMQWPQTGTAMTNGMHADHLVDAPGTGAK